MSDVNTVSCPNVYLLVFRYFSTGGGITETLLTWLLKNYVSRFVKISVRGCTSEYAWLGVELLAHLVGGVCIVGDEHRGRCSYCVCLKKSSTCAVSIQ
jgi:hypothetical protein